jgi:hypothetical protein
LSAVDGPGSITVVTGPDPGNGNEGKITQPANTRWRIRSIVLELDTSIVVANRTVGVNIVQGGQTLFLARAPAVQTASLASVYTFGPGLQWLTNPPQVQTIPTPIDLMLSSGAEIRSYTVNLDPGDHYLPLVASVEEWIDV